TWTARVAQVTTEILTSLGVSSAALSSREWTEATGIYHCTNSGEATWFEFAEAVLQADPRREEHRATRVEPITSAEYPTAAPRPGYTVLDATRVRERFGGELPPWEADLSRALRS